MFLIRRILAKQFFLNDTPPDPAAELAAAKAEIATLKAEHEKLKATPPPPPPKDDLDLAAKAKADREAKETDDAKSKKLETALKFEMGSKDWLKNNAALLPPSIEGIFAASEKEKYESTIHKAADIKVGIVSEFFSVQANLDQLTDGQKNKVAAFLALTKNVKQERVQEIYDDVFEPTLESIRKVKKAEALQKGLATPTGSEDEYTKRLIDGSKKHHLREKK